MGFIISGDHSCDLVKELRQHVNLSHSAWMVIDEDIRCFSNGEKPNRTGFLNRIFTNFYQEAEATVSYRLHEKKEQILGLFASVLKRSKSKVNADMYLSVLLEEYENELISRICGYEKGEGYKFRINKVNVGILRDSEENVYYDDDHNNPIGAYLKAIFEEYALKPMYERERIYFKSTADTVLSAISQKKKIKISKLKTVDPERQRSCIKRYYFAPYRIIQDKARMFNYVVGYSEELTSDGSLSERVPDCFRISRIEQLHIMSSMSGFISKADQERLERMIAEKGPQFMIGDIISLKVRFTDAGIELFNRQLYMRPSSYEKVEGEKNTYLFNCTEFQAINYFFRFAADAEIVEPSDTREKFIKLYRAAYEKYFSD